MENKNLQQFLSFTSNIDPSFWHKLCQIKLDIDKLEEKERKIWGYYNNTDSRADFSVDVSSFNSSAEKSQGISVQGVLINKNTIESFKDCDKANLLQQQGKILEEAVIKGDVIKNPSLILGQFLLLSFADLKKYHFYYWFAFLAPKSLNVLELEPSCSIGNKFSEQQIQDLEIKLTSCEQHCCTIKLTSSGSVEVLPLSEYGQTKEENVFIGFADPSNKDGVPGWPLRSLLWLVSSTWPDIKSVDVLCIRRQSNKLSNSIVLKLALGAEESPKEVQWVGWERNERGKLGPRLANLGSSMDPVKLAESAVDLNLKLMKWRLLPQLDLDIISSSKCLLLGAGTLGCAVARCLLGWGVRKITFLDAGRVGYSNPVRQSLFLHRHCLSGGAAKATAAAESLKAIFPGVIAEGVQISIPMPGHSVTDSQLSEVQSECRKLEELIESHDVIFLLTDTRESRWLPCLLAKLHGKIVINAALGFDTFLVMRHGIPANTSNESPDLSKKNIAGNQLGCYFCNDVVAPRNSMAARTLDQQCTVVRPGVAQIAAALAVELLVSVLQHPEKGGAPASCDPDPQAMFDSGCSLGAVPHSIRGFLAQFQLVLPASHAFTKCAACSDMVLNEYRKQGFDFLLQAFNSPGYLEDITGLTELQQQSLDAEVWALSDSEDTD